jgi:hypothetical protein
MDLRNHAVQVVFLDCMDTVVAGSNRAGGMSAFSRPSALAVLRRQSSCVCFTALTRSSAKCINSFVTSGVILRWNRPQGPIRKSWYLFIFMNLFFIC